MRFWLFVFHWLSELNLGLSWRERCSVSRLMECVTYRRGKKQAQLCSVFLTAEFQIPALDLSRRAGVTLLLLHLGLI